MEHEADSFAWPRCEGYHVVRPLSETDYCKVWMVQHEQEQCYRVIKMIDSHEAVASLNQAAHVEGAEHLIEFYGVLQSDQGLVLVAEYCPGGSLAQMVLARGMLPLGEAITALAPIAQTVAALHRHGIEHGDISPNNILLTAEGMPKLSDFQESRLLLEGLATAGTPGFMAPEKLAGQQGPASGAADVYALGACLWFLLCGKVPELPEQRPPVNLVLPDMPEVIMDLLVEALHEDSAQRPSAEQFARTLFASGQAEPLNWRESVPGYATHLMATIHPEDTSSGPGRTYRRRSQRASKLVRRPAAGHRARKQRLKLKLTPGGRKLALSAALGLMLMVLTGFGVQWWVNTQPTNATSKQNGQPQQPVQSCTMQSDAQLPPCAQDQALLLTELLQLSQARDAALNAADRLELVGLYTEQSEQLALDLQLLENLDQLGLSIDGLHTSLAELSVVARRYPDVVVIAAQSVHSPYSYRLARTRDIAHEAKAGLGEMVRFELRYEDQGWKLSRVLERENKSGTVANDDPTNAETFSSRG